MKKKGKILEFKKMEEIEEMEKTNRNSEKESSILEEQLLNPELDLNEVADLLPDVFYLSEYKLKNGKIYKNIKKVLDKSKLFLFNGEQDHLGREKVYIYILAEANTTFIYLDKNNISIQAETPETRTKAEKLLRGLFKNQIKLNFREDISPVHGLEMMFIEEFINSPIEDFENRTPLEIMNGDLQMQDDFLAYLTAMELVSVYDENLAILEGHLNFYELKKRLGIEVNPNDPLRDGVEQLIAEKFVNDYEVNYFLYAIEYWRVFKKNNQGKIKGWDKSWAAGLDYFISRQKKEAFSNFNYSKDDVAKKYGVSAGTVHAKYKALEKRNI